MILSQMVSLWGYKLGYYVNVSLVSICYVEKASEIGHVNI